MTLRHYFSTAIMGLVLLASTLTGSGMDAFYGGPYLGLYNPAGSEYGAGLRLGAYIDKPLAKKVVISSQLGLVRALRNEDRIIKNLLSFDVDAKYPVYYHNQNIVYVNGGFQFQNTDNGSIAAKVGVVYKMPFSHKSFGLVKFELSKNFALSAVYGQYLPEITQIYRRHVVKNREEKIQKIPEDAESIKKKRELVQTIGSPLVSKIKNRDYSAEKNSTSIPWVGFSIKEQLSIEDEAVSEVSITVDQLSILPKYRQKQALTRLEAYEATLLLLNTLNVKAPVSKRNSLVKRSPGALLKLKEPLITQVMSFQDHQLSKIEPVSGPLYSILYPSPIKKVPYKVIHNVSEELDSYVMLLEGIHRKLIPYSSLKNGVGINANAAITKREYFSFLAKIVADIDNHKKYKVADKTIEKINSYETERLQYMFKTLQLNKAHSEGLNDHLSRQDFVHLSNLFLDWKNGGNISPHHTLQYKVIVGTFSNYQYALNFKNKLQLQFLDPIIEPKKTAKGIVYRVQTDSFDSIQTAQEHVQLLAERKIKGIILK